MLAYSDGTLRHHRSSLGAAIAGLMRQFDPDTVITFGADGGYGHPDHVAISGLTTDVFRGLARDHDRGQRLYHAVFPPQRTCMAEELAHWIAASGQRADVRMEWFSPGTCVIEQGEPADALYLVLNGMADALLERKLEALARRPTQYPVVPSMLPQNLLQQMLGTEFFHRTAGCSPNVASSWAKAPRSPVASGPPVAAAPAPAS